MECCVKDIGGDWSVLVLCAVVWREFAVVGDNNYNNNSNGSGTNSAGKVSKTRKILTKTQGPMDEEHMNRI